MEFVVDDPQNSLNKIHELAVRIQSFRNCEDKIVRRLTIGLLSDIRKYTESLFENNGSNSKSILKGLHDVECTVAKLENRSSLKRMEPSNCITTELNGQVPGKLSQIINSIHRIEATFQFQRSLWHQKGLISTLHGCTVDQLTYGSTSFQTWCEVTTSDPWMRVMRTKKAPKLIIFGSSQGLLAFYSITLFPNLRCIGYEILPVLHELAVSQSVQHNLGDVRFQLESMLQADVSAADVLVLTSLCWDQSTKIQVACKLAAELPTGCVVIDYEDNSLSLGSARVQAELLPFSQSTSSSQSSTSALCHHLPLTHNEPVTTTSLMALLSQSLLASANEEPTTPPPPRPLHTASHLRLDMIVQGPVSWNTEQKLYIYTMCR